MKFLSCLLKKESSGSDGDCHPCCLQAHIYLECKTHQKPSSFVTSPPWSLQESQCAFKAVLMKRTHGMACTDSAELFLPVLFLEQAALHGAPVDFCCSVDLPAPAVPFTLPTLETESQILLITPPSSFQ